MGVPMSENVTCEREPTGLTLTYRWFSGHTFWVVVGVFALVWNGLMGFILVSLLANESAWDQYLMMAPFAGFGLLMAYVTLANIFNGTVIQLTPAELTVRHVPLPWRGNRSLPVSGLKQIYCKEVKGTDSEGEPYVEYHLLAVMYGGKETILLKDSLERLRYFEREINAWLSRRDVSVAGELSL
jgi:hypothetical protein